MKKYYLKLLIVSILVHGLFGLGLVVSTIGRPSGVPLRKTKEVLNFEVIQSKEPLKESQGLPGSQSRERKMDVSSFFKVARANRGLNNEIAVGEIGLDQKNSNERFSKDSIFEAMSDPYLSAIWGRVDQSVDFPEILIKNRIKGQVTIVLELDHAGVFQGNLISVKGTQRVLEAYVTAMVIRGLRRPLPDFQYSKKKWNLVEVHFLFDFYGYGAFAPETKKEIFSNSLSFQRWAKVEGRFNERLEYYLTNYFPPIFPIPGGFYIDFIRTYQLIQNLSDNKPIIDPDDKNAELLQKNLEQWDLTVQRKKSN